MAYNNRRYGPKRARVAPIPVSRDRLHIGQRLAIYIECKDKNIAIPVNVTVLERYPTKGVRFVTDKGHTIFVKVGNIRRAPTCQV